MAHAVLIQNPISIYDDAHGERYHFPRRYLGRLEACVGDWVIFYEGKAGALGYTHVQKVAGIRPDPADPTHFYADLDLSTLLGFEAGVVPRQRPDGRRYETGLPASGGSNVSAVRSISQAEFAAIVEAGLAPRADADAHPRTGPLFDGLQDVPQARLAGDRLQVLTSRPLRDAQFARMVKRAYDGRCAISGLRLRNGGGRAEVQAAHIRPVADGGPDVVPNGLALSGTLHWMFDRGLVSVAEDHRILVSHNKVDAETARRLFAPDMRLRLPADPRMRPHPDYLAYHREEVFGRA
ncbi:HNH endonuclease [uncultured Jannaschia sp.]|uniref:HNH endonuclease n=1 Tax=uncultured Jannaschia sp. TaxID=293347 RepID=UPI002624A111|nr:HNH endonuclease [uncultured Jannaschia sp.]